MEDKNFYNKLMFSVFCIIVVLLCVGAYSWFRGRADLTALPGSIPVKEVMAEQVWANV